MTFRTSIMAMAALLIAFSPAFADTETVITKEVGVDGTGATTTTTTRYYYNDSDLNNNGILDSQEFDKYVYNRWDMNGDGFISDDEWEFNTVRWYPKGYSEYKTYTYWDEDHDGKLDPEEFNSVVTTTKLYNTWDANADNTLENNEFTASTFRLYDTDNDGIITLSEWQQSR